MLLDRLNQALAQAKRYQRAVAVMFLDLDRFKLINDTLGHDIGDELLKEVATRLNACVRSGDTVARQGGDEFVIVLAEVAHSQDAALVAEKIISTLGQPIFVNSHELQVTTSIGIALFPVNGTDDAQELMRKADAAMYAAKEAGRNGYRFC
jgi:diguanylate cyclase (GGDEF)-like protein